MKWQMQFGGRGESLLSDLLGWKEIRSTSPAPALSSLMMLNWDSNGFPDMINLNNRIQKSLKMGTVNLCFLTICETSNSIIASHIKRIKILLKLLCRVSFGFELMIQHYIISQSECYMAVAPQHYKIASWNSLSLMTTYLKGELTLDSAIYIPRKPWYYLWKSLLVLQRTSFEQYNIAMDCKHQILIPPSFASSTRYLSENVQIDKALCLPKWH